MEREDVPGEGRGTWVEALAEEPGVRAELAEEVAEVARAVAAEHAGEEGAGPDEAARDRFRAFARRTLDEA